MAGNGKSLSHGHLRTKEGPQSQRKPFLFTDLRGALKTWPKAGQEPQLLCQESKQEEPRKELRGQEGVG